MVIFVWRFLQLDSFLFHFHYPSCRILAIYFVPRKPDLLYCEIRRAEVHDLVDLQVRLSSWVLGGHGWTLSGDDSGK